MALNSNFLLQFALAAAIISSKRKLCQTFQSKPMFYNVQVHTGINLRMIAVSCRIALATPCRLIAVVSIS